MSPDDARLVAALTVLRDQLGPVVDAIMFGELDAEDRRELARALRTVADALTPLVVINEAVSERDRRQYSIMKGGSTVPLNHSSTLDIPVGHMSIGNVKGPK